MNLGELEEALLPHGKKLRAQERLRRLLGVREVDRPTYERYIIGPIERFDRRKTTFSTLMPNNPFGEEFRKRFKARTGHDSRDPLPYSELESEDRIGHSLSSAAWRLCREYYPEALPITSSEGGGGVTKKLWMSAPIT